MGADFVSQGSGQRTGERSRRLTCEFLWIALGQAGAISGAMVGIRILTGLLTPQVYGKLVLGMTAVSLVSQVILRAFGQGAARFFASAREAGTLHSYWAAMKQLVVAATGTVLLISLVTCVTLVSTGQTTWVLFCLTTSGFALLLGYDGVLNCVQGAARQRAVVSLHQTLSIWGRYLLAGVVIMWLGASCDAAMLGYLLSMVLVLVSQWVFLRRTISKPTGQSTTHSEDVGLWRRDIFSYSWPFVAFGVFTWAHAASGRWFLQVFATAEGVGVYAVLYQLGYYPIVVLTDLVMRLASPIFFERAGDASDAARLRHLHAINKRLMLGTLLLTAVASVVAFGTHEFVFRWLVSPEYRFVSWLLPGTVLAGGLFATGQLISLSVVTETRTTSLLFPKVVTALIGIGSNAVGAVLYGVKGVVAANVVFSVFYCVWMYVVALYCWRKHAIA